MIQGNIWTKALFRARRNNWLRSLGRIALRLPGAGSALRRFTHKILPRGERVWFQIPNGIARGLWLKVEPYLEEKYLTGSPEPGVDLEITKHLQPGGAFFDVGAHIGFYSLLAARLVGREGRVVAFEPDPANVEVLRENLLRNRLSQVEVIPAAVWSHHGLVTFQSSASGHPEVSSRTGAVVEPSGKPPDPGLIEVNAVTLDEYAEGHRHPIMVKVDVEGAEAEVLKGAQKLISQKRPIMLFEVHHLKAATFLEDQLRRNGYKIEWLPRHPKSDFPRHLLTRPRE